MHFSLRYSTIFLALLGWSVHGCRAATTEACKSSAIPYPEVFGAEITSLSATKVTNYSLALPQQDMHFAMNVTGLAFCNVSVEYTHPGQGDRINVQIWLPLENWNGRFMGTGGGGYSSGENPAAMTYAVSLGYATVSTDGGHVTNTVDPSSWALKSQGNINWPLLQDFAAISLDDSATIGKAISTSYYGSAPKYSYWNGCSTGGRQGHMMAQRYPTQYDGIMAAAPAINWAKFVAAEYWPQLVMNQLGVYPSPCEFEAITAAATAACDSLDGVVDGIIAAPGLCDFDPNSVVGQIYNCTTTNTTITISSAAAKIALAAWQGAHDLQGKSLWYGLNRDGPLWGLVNTSCTDTNCTGAPFPIASSWLTYFVQRDASFDPTTLTATQYDALFRESQNQFASIISTADPDLTSFHLAGGKMIAWHGLADELIFPNGTFDHYRRVLEGDSNARDYYRVFSAPGVEHCGGGIGYYPSTSLQALVDWVEHGVAPDTLAGTTLPDANGKTRQAPLCQWPLVAAYVGGDQDVASSFHCKESF